MDAGHRMCEGWQALADLSDSDPDRARRARDSVRICLVLLVASLVNLVMGVVVHGLSAVTWVAVGSVVIVAVGLVLARKGSSGGAAGVLVLGMIAIPASLIWLTGQVAAWIMVAPACALVLIVMLPLRSAPVVVIGVLCYLGAIGVVLAQSDPELVDPAAMLRTQALMTVVIVVLTILGTASLVQALRRQHEQERMLDQAQALARRDTLTGLFNRRAEDDLRSGLAHPPESGVALLSVAMIDLDGFKPVNDVLGHDVGDAVLVEVSQVMREASRHADVLVRHGGDEFVLVMPSAGLADASAMCDRLRRTVVEHAWEVPLGTVTPPTISVGVADTTECPRWDELVALADERLLAAKAAGRNCVVAGSA